MADRRTFLKTASAVGGTALLPAAAAASAHAAPGSRPAFIVDARLPRAGELGQRAAALGHRVLDPQGEMIALLLQHEAALIGPGRHLIGLTGYADFALARDLLRLSGHPIRHAAALGGPDGQRIVIRGSARDRAVLDALFAEHPSSFAPGRVAQATSFVWLA